GLSYLQPFPTRRSSDLIGVSNTAEWWPKEHRGFAIGAHHAGYPVGAMLSGVVMASIIYYFGPENWRYAFYLGIIISVPVLTFWVIYSTRQRYDEFHDSCIEHGFTPPTENAPIEAQSENKKQAKKGLLKKTLKSRGILFTAGSTLITHIVYLGFLTIFPAYLY